MFELPWNWQNGQRLKRYWPGFLDICNGNSCYISWTYLFHHSLDHIIISLQGTSHASITDEFNCDLTQTCEILVNLDFLTFAVEIFVIYHGLICHITVYIYCIIVVYQNCIKALPMLVRQMSSNVTSFWPLQPWQPSWGQLGLFTVDTVYHTIAT